LEGWSHRNKPKSRLKQVDALTDRKQGPPLVGADLGGIPFRSENGSDLIARVAKIKPPSALLRSSMYA